MTWVHENLTFFLGQRKRKREDADDSDVTSSTQADDVHVKPADDSYVSYVREALAAYNDGKPTPTDTNATTLSPADDSDDVIHSPADNSGDVIRSPADDSGDVIHSPADDSDVRPAKQAKRLDASDISERDLLEAGTSHQQDDDGESMTSPQPEDDDDDDDVAGAVGSRRFSETINPLAHLSRDDLASMDREVDEMSDDSSEEGGGEGEEGRKDGGGGGGDEDEELGSDDATLRQQVRGFDICIFVSNYQCFSIPSSACSLNKSYKSQS